MKRLLIVYHSQFGGTRQIAEAAWRGARTTEDIDSALRRAAGLSAGIF